MGKAARVAEGIWWVGCGSWGGHTRPLSDEGDGNVFMVQGIVDRVNSTLPRYEQIKYFRLIPKELDHEDGELTATQKLKRSAMLDAFGELVDSMY